MAPAPPPAARPTGLPPVPVPGGDAPLVAKLAAGLVVPHVAVRTLDFFQGQRVRG